MKNVDITKIPSKYHGKWVVLESPDSPRIIVSGTSISEVISKAEKLGYNGLLITRVPKAL